MKTGQRYFKCHCDLNLEWNINWRLSMFWGGGWFLGVTLTGSIIGFSLVLDVLFQRKSWFLMQIIFCYCRDLNHWTHDKILFVFLLFGTMRHKKTNKPFYPFLARLICLCGYSNASYNSLATIIHSNMQETLWKTFVLEKLLLYLLLFIFMAG